jgi:pyruvate kinase
MNNLQTLLTDVKVGETLYFNDGEIAITLDQKNGQRCKLRIVHRGAKVSRTLSAEKIHEVTKIV